MNFFPYISKTHKTQITFVLNYTSVFYLLLLFLRKITNGTILSLKTWIYLNNLIHRIFLGRVYNRQLFFHIAIKEYAGKTQQNLNILSLCLAKRCIKTISNFVLTQKECRIFRLRMCPAWRPPVTAFNSRRLKVRSVYMRCTGLIRFGGRFELDCVRGTNMFALPKLPRVPRYKTNGFQLPF